jgi:hypothetical protein
MFANAFVVLLSGACDVRFDSWARLPRTAVRWLATPPRKLLCAGSLQCGAARELAAITRVAPGSASLSAGCGRPDLASVFVILAALLCSAFGLYVRRDAGAGASARPTLLVRRHARLRRPDEPPRGRPYDVGSGWRSIACICREIQDTREVLHRWWGSEMKMGGGQPSPTTTWRFGLRCANQTANVYPTFLQAPLGDRMVGVPADIYYASCLASSLPSAP